VQTTGEPPLGLLLDNKVVNHTAEVDAALGDTLRMRSASVDSPQRRTTTDPSTSSLRRRAITRLPGLTRIGQAAPTPRVAVPASGVSSPLRPVAAVRSFPAVGV
jgi:hypothetical protein